jgi:hypothetical protein
MTSNKIFSFFLILLGITFLYSDDYFQDNECPMEKEDSDDYMSEKDGCPEEEDLFNKDCSAVFINGEFLYWTVSEGALDYALTMKNPAPMGAGLLALGDFRRAKFDWDPGFRVALGYYHSQKLMNVWGEYTRIRVKNSNSAKKPDDADLYLTATFPTALGILLSAKSRIRMHYDLVDFLVARVFIPNPHLRLRLLGGLTGARLRQKWNIVYYDDTDSAKAINRWRFLGGGLKIGLGIDWFWISDFYLTGKTVFGFLVGKYKNRAIRMSTTTTPENVPFGDSKYEHYRPSFTTQFIIGPSWQKTFSCSRVEIFAGYEFNGWFNLHEIFRSRWTGDQEDEKETYINRELLALHGLTVRMTVDF